MDLAPIQRQIAALGLDDVVELRAHRLSEPEMAELFAATDCFLFPYRQIDASGVYYLTKALGKWMIASRVGIFAEDLADGSRGALVAPEAPDQLASAIANGHRRAAAARPVRAGSRSGGTSGPRRCACTRPRLARREPAVARAHRPAGPPRWRLNERHAWLFVDGARSFGGHEIMLLRLMDELARQGRVRPRLLARGRHGAARARRHPRHGRSAAGRRQPRLARSRGCGRRSPTLR